MKMFNRVAKNVVIYMFGYMGGKIFFVFYEDFKTKFNFLWRIYIRVYKKNMTRIKS